jgi:hypothetical protein
MSIEVRTVRPSLRGAARDSLPRRRDILPRSIAETRDAIRRTPGRRILSNPDELKPRNDQCPMPVRQDPEQTQDRMNMIHRMDSRLDGQMRCDRSNSPGSPHLVNHVYPVKKSGLNVRSGNGTFRPVRHIYGPDRIVNRADTGATAGFGFRYDPPLSCSSESRTSPVGRPPLLTPLLAKPSNPRRDRLRRRLCRPVRPFSPLSVLSLKYSSE